jgi:hypothetical protein
MMEDSDRKIFVGVVGDERLFTKCNANGEANWK